MNHTVAAFFKVPFERKSDNMSELRHQHILNKDKITSLYVNVLSFSSLRHKKMPTFI